MSGGVSRFRGLIWMPGTSNVRYTWPGLLGVIYIPCGNVYSRSPRSREWLSERRGANTTDEEPNGGFRYDPVRPPRTTTGQTGGDLFIGVHIHPKCIYSCKIFISRFIIDTHFYRFIEHTRRKKDYLGQRNFCCHNKLFSYSNKNLAVPNNLFSPCRVYEKLRRKKNSKSTKYPLTNIKIAE